jgi:hypothetical protein
MGNGQTTTTNGHPAAILPPATKLIRGVSLAHRQLSKTQLAVLGANVHDGLARYIQTDQQIADAFGISRTYLAAACKLSPERPRRS